MNNSRLAVDLNLKTIFLNFSNDIIIYFQHDKS